MPILWGFENAQKPKVCTRYKKDTKVSIVHTFLIFYFFTENPKIRAFIDFSLKFTYKKSVYEILPNYTYLQTLCR